MSESLADLLALLERAEPSKRMELRAPVLGQGVGCVGPLLDLARRRADLADTVAAWLEYLAKTAPEAAASAAAALTVLAAFPEASIARAALIRLQSGGYLRSDTPPDLPQYDGPTVTVDGFKVPPPGYVGKGDRVAFGVVQTSRRAWYLVTSDGKGLYGNVGNREGNPGCGCAVAESRLTVIDGHEEPVRYLFVGGVPADHAGIPSRGFVCTCHRYIPRPVMARRLRGNPTH